MEGDMERAATIPPAETPSSADGTPDRRRLIASFVFAAVTLGACVLLAKRFTHTSWPLQRANLGLVGGAVALYFASYVCRALGWQKLFPAASRPDRARCLAACGLLVAGRHLLALPFVARRARLSKLVGRAAEHRLRTREAISAWFFLLGCWTSRALGSTVLLAGLGVGFSPTLALVVLCLAAAASLIPIASGGAVANVSATAAVLLALGVHKEQAINFGLASGLLLCGTALAAAVVGVATSFACGWRAQTLARAVA